MKNDVFVNIHLSPYHKMVMQEMATRFGYNSISAFARDVIIGTKVVEDGVALNTRLATIVIDRGTFDLIKAKADAEKIPVKEYILKKIFS
jgi:hypothetical protein